MPGLANVDTELKFKGWVGFEVHKKRVFYRHHYVPGQCLKVKRCIASPAILKGEKCRKERPRDTQRRLVFPYSDSSWICYCFERVQHAHFPWRPCRRAS